MSVDPLAKYTQGNADPLAKYTNPAKRVLTSPGRITGTLSRDRELTLVEELRQKQYPNAGQFYAQHKDHDKRALAKVWGYFQQLKQGGVPDPNKQPGVPGTLAGDVAGIYAGAAKEAAGVLASRPFAAVGLPGIAVKPPKVKADKKTVLRNVSGGAETAAGLASFPLRIMSTAADQLLQQVGLGGIPTGQSDIRQAMEDARVAQMMQADIAGMQPSNWANTPQLSQVPYQKPRTMSKAQTLAQTVGPFSKEEMADPVRTFATGMVEPAVSLFTTPLEKQWESGQLLRNVLGTGLLAAGGVHAAGKLRGKLRGRAPIPPEAAAAELSVLEPVIAEGRATPAIVNRVAELRKSMPSVADVVKPVQNPVGKPPTPPAEPVKVAAGAGIPPNVTGVRKAITEPLRSSLGLPEVEKQLVQKFGEAYDDAVRQIQSGEMNPLKLAQEVVEKPRGLKPVETAGLAHEIAKTTKLYDDLSKSRDEAYTNGDMLTAETAQAKLDGLLGDVDTLTAAARRSGRELGAGLNAMKIAVDKDNLSLVNLVMKRAKNHHQGKDPSIHEQNIISSLKKQVDDLQAKLDAKLEASQGVIQRSKRPTSPSDPRYGKDNRIVSSERAAIVSARLKEKMNALHAGVDPTMLADVVELMVYHLEAFPKWQYGKLHAYMKQNYPKLDSKTIRAAYQQAANDKRLETAKKRIITDTAKIDEAIATGEPIPEAPRVWYDKEAINLKIKRDNARARLEKYVGPKKTVGRMAKAGVIEAGGLLRTVLTGEDISAPFRQGRRLLVSHPKAWAKAWIPQIKSFASKVSFANHEEAIKSHPDFETIWNSGLDLTLAEGPGGSLAREEMFQSSIGDKIPLIAGSNRAYTAYMNDLRFNVMVDHLNALRKTGEYTPERLREFATLVNDMGGRGSLGKYKNVAPLANALAFAPRKFVGDIRSHLDWKILDDPKARKTAAKEMVMYYTAVAGGITLLKIAGAKVSTDPDSADFLKARFGNLRVDLTGGDATMFRYLFKIIRSGRKKSGSNKRVPSIEENVGRFLHSKASPLVGKAIDFGTGKDFLGRDVYKEYRKNPVRRTIEDFMPMVANDILDAYEAQGPKAAVVAGALSATGVGVQTYKDKTGSGSYKFTPSSFKPKFNYKP